MAWFSRFTRFGDMHLVYGQEAGMSCGIASVMMCVFKLNKLRPGSKAVTVERDITARYRALVGGSYDSESTGTYPQHLAAILTGFTPGTWSWKQMSPESMSQAVIDRVGVRGPVGPAVTVEPVILGVDWDQGGAHWVVVDTVRQILGATFATVCDPWDTNVHIVRLVPGQAFTYHAGAGGLMLNFGGESIAQSRDLPYGNASRGQVKYWGMISRD